MKLGFIFLCLGAIIFLQAIASENIFIEIAAGSAGISVLAVGLCYLLRSPKAFLKTKHGTLSPLGFIFFWPYHAMNYFSLAAFRLFSRKPPFHEISSGLFLGCRLFPADEAKMTNLNIRSVLDLTSEFSEVGFLRRVSSYLCIPLLDTGAPSITELKAGIQFIESRLREGPVYVHCALGHGRSATFIIGYLMVVGAKQNLEEAISFVQSKRAGVKLHAEQLAVLRQLKYE